MNIPEMDPPVQADEQQPPPLPAWAYLARDRVHVRGDDLNSGDTIYMSKTAYPRILWTQVSRTLWSVLEVRGHIHKRDQLAVEPDQYYVVKRATRR